MGGNGIGMKSTERKFSAPPWKSGNRRQPVLEVARVEQLAAASDVEHHGQTGLLRDLPDREEADVARRVALRTAGGDQQGLAAHLDHLLRHLAGAREVRERHVAGREQPPVHRAEVDHRAVVGAGDADRVIEIVGVLDPVQELVEEGVEDQLRFHAEQIERTRAVLLEERARRAPVLAQHDLLLVARPVDRIGVPPPHALDQGLLARADGREVELREPFAHGGIGEGVQPVGGLDDVGVGVVNAAVLDVRHAGILRPSIGPGSA